MSLDKVFKDEVEFISQVISQTAAAPKKFHELMKYRYHKLKEIKDSEGAAAVLAMYGKWIRCREPDFDVDPAGSAPSSSSK